MNYKIKEADKPNVKFEDCEELLCPNLRYTRDHYYPNRGKSIHDDYVSFWVAKEKDPCPTCKRTCHNSGKKFHNQELLIIDKSNKEGD